MKSKHHQGARGTRIVLRLPPRKQLQAFVRDQVMPQLRAQMNACEKMLRIAIDDNEVGLDITINPAGSPCSSCGFAAYDVPTIKDRNPLYNALKAKATQLRGAEGVTGVIVGDGDCTALADRPSHWAEVSATTIVEEFLRQYSSIDFVLLLMVRERPRSSHRAEPAERWVRPMFIVRQGCQAKDQLDVLFSTMLAELPKPVAMPVNAALRAREPGYDLGHHGGYSMGGRKIRISSRELMEILAGLRTLEDNGVKNIEASRRMPRQPNPAQTAFLRNLQEGRLPAVISVIRTDEDDDDDWIEFEFGNPDPAISPLS